MKAAQLDLVVTLSAPTLSPHGSHIVVAARHPSFAADAYVGQLWEIDTADGAAPRRITAGVLDSLPRYSPDGTMIGFLRQDEKGRRQFAVVDACGGEARVLTALPLGVTDFVWDRASLRVALVAPIPEEGRYGTLDGVDAGKEDPRRITGNQVRENGRGYIADQPLGIVVMRVPPLEEEPWVKPVGRGAAALAAEGGEESGDPNVFGGANGIPFKVLVTPEGRDAVDPEFSPDGEWLYFTAALHDERDEDLRTMIHRMRLRGPIGPQEVLGVITQDEAENAYRDKWQLVVSDPERAYSGARFSRDGETLYMFGLDLGESGRDFVARQAGVFALDAAKIGAKKPKAPRELTDRDTTDYGVIGARLIPYGESAIAAIARVRGSGELHSITPEGKVKKLVEGKRVVTGADSADRMLAVSVTDPTTPGELSLVERINGAGVLRSLSTFAAQLNRETRVVAPRELSVKASDGYHVHGWLFMPEGEGPHPVLLNIHGGPFAEYDWSWFDEAQVYAEAGYAVVQCNPRGSASYGRAHGLAIKERMGTRDYEDVLDFLCGALKSEKSLDKSRLGILGGSYGGYLTAWTIAHDHRFKAAVVERGYLDPASFAGTSDIGWFFSDEYMGTDPDRVAAQSPMAVVDDVKTPTLVLHSEQDWRCPIEQAQRYFARLRANGVETEMLVFPGENHELSRSGTPWHRRQRFEAILEWFGRYLPVRD
ncbi:MAG TPA: S9 family peptidase [Actinomycetaceae bacterium]|nr:S9 family peptidase [Actinomycetaceae bacterium]